MALIDEAAKANDVLAALYRRARRDYGSDLTHRAIRVLQFIAFSETPPRIDDVARQIGAAPSTASELLKRLAGRGFVVRRRAEDDERVVRLTLTPAGRAALGEHTTLDPEKLARGLGSLKKTEREELARLLERVVDGLEET